MRDRVLRLFLAATSVVLTIALCEAGARVWLHRLASEEAFLRYAALVDLDEGRLASRRVGSERRYSPHRYLGYYPTPGYAEGLNRHNRLGFRGEEIPPVKAEGEYRIVCLGGSTTYTQVEDHRLSYPAQLEAELRRRGFAGIRVINAGAESYSSWESLVNLEFRVLDLEPDLVIVYHAVNDAHARLVWPRAAYRPDNSGRRLPNASSIVMPGIAEHSTLLRILLVRLGRIAPHADLARTIDRAPGSFRADELWRQWKAKTYPSGIFAEVSAEAMLEANPPRYFERNLRSMIAIAHEHGIKIVIATFATTHVFGDVSGSSPAYLRAIAENNEVNRRVASGPGVHLLDLATDLPRDRKYWSDGEHVNARGAGLKARLVADYLIAEGLLAGLPAARAAAR